VSEVIAVFSFLKKRGGTPPRKADLRLPANGLSLMASVALGLSVGGIHVSSAAMAPWLRVTMMIKTMLIARPNGDKDLQLARDMWGGARLHFNTPMLLCDRLRSMS